MLFYTPISFPSNIVVVIKMYLGKGEIHPRTGYESPEGGVEV
jgi:hypothetical protein